MACLTYDDGTPCGGNLGCAVCLRHEKEVTTTYYYPIENRHAEPEKPIIKEEQGSPCKFKLGRKKKKWARGRMKHVAPWEK